MYQMIALSAVHQAVHDVQDPDPEIKHALPLAEDNQVVQEDLAQQCGGLYPRVAHTARVILENLRFQETTDEREQNIAEDGSPFVMVFACQFR